MGFLKIYTHLDNYIALTHWRIEMLNLSMIMIYPFDCSVSLLKITNVTKVLMANFKIISYIDVYNIL